MRDYPTYNQWTGQVALKPDRFQGKHFSSGSEYSYRVLKRELRNMTLAKVENLPDDIRDWVKELRQTSRETKVPESPATTKKIERLRSVVRAAKSLMELGDPSFKITIDWDAGAGKYVAEAPQLGCLECGDTKEEAYERVSEAIDEGFEELFSSVLNDSPVIDLPPEDWSR